MATDKTQLRKSEAPVMAREFDARIAELVKSVRSGDTANRDHADTMFRELRVASEMAEREREKAAQILADALSASIIQGDNQLSQHIAAQVEQIRSALQSATRLTDEAANAMEQRSSMRDSAIHAEVDERIANLQVVHANTRQGLQAAMNEADRALASQVADADGQLRTSINKLADLMEIRFTDAKATSQSTLSSMQREFALVNEASEKAIQKAEVASEKRFDSVNEFRAQLADQGQTFMPREVADAINNEQSKRIEALELRIASGRARDDGKQQDVTNLYTKLGVMIAASAVFITIAVIVVNLVNHKP